MLVRHLLQVMVLCAKPNTIPENPAPFLTIQTHTHMSDMVSAVLRKRPLLDARCSRGCSVCVSLRHGLVIVSNYGTTELHAYSLVDGSYVRSIGRHKGRFYPGRLCICPDGDCVLVSDCYKNRVRQIRITGNTCVRFVGEDRLINPEFVDCNSEAIVVLEQIPRISVFSWQTGDVVSQFGREGRGPGQLKNPQALRLLSRNRLVVVDTNNRRLCVFGLRGEFIENMQAMTSSKDVLECRSGFVIASIAPNLAVMSSAGEIMSVHSCSDVAALAALPDGGLVARERSQFQVFVGLHLRVAWAQFCAIFVRGV